MEEELVVGGTSFKIAVNMSSENNDGLVWFMCVCVCVCVCVCACVYLSKISIAVITYSMLKTFICPK